MWRSCHINKYLVLPFLGVIKGVRVWGGGSG